MKAVDKSLEFSVILDKIAQLAESQEGKEAVHQFRPAQSVQDIERDFDGIEEVKGLLMRFPTLFLPQIDLNLQIFSLEEIYGLLKFLVLISEIKSLPVRKDGMVDELISRLDPIKELRVGLEKVFDNSGAVRDNASSQLKEIRKSIKKTHDQLVAQFNKIIKRKHKMLNNDQMMTRSGRFVLCLKQELRSKLKGVVHDISDSGHSVFIEPEQTINMQNHLEELKIRERREIERIVRRLSEEIGMVRHILQIDINIVIRLDTILARARYAQEIDAVRPKLNREGKLNIVGGRHPILYFLKKDKTVPLDLTLDAGILVVTGPNAGGKTVLLKTVGLLSLMANSGIFVPAEYGTDIPLVDKIFAKIGDDQSIASDLSSFGAQIEIVKHILREASTDSLILLDELGSNTSPVEGSALACAILEEIAKLGSLCIATTHSEELKTYAYQHEGFKIGAMGYNGGPTYRFQPDFFAPSCAFSVAERLGISASVLTRAKELVDGDKGRFEELTYRLSNEKATLEKRRKELEQELKDMQEVKKDYQSRLDEIKDWKKRQRREFDQKLKKILREARREVEHLIQKLSTTGPDKQLVKDIKARIDSLEPKQEPRPVKELAMNTMVEVDGIRGRVVDRKRDDYLVEMGRIRCWLHSSQLKEVDSDSHLDLHLRGKKRDEVAYLMDKFLDRAITDNILEVRIVHGKGGGLVKQEVDTFLRKDKRVRDFELDPGNPGQTIVRLNG